MSPFVALLGHGAMSELSPLSAAKRKLDFGAVRAAFDPERTSGITFGARQKAPDNAGASDC